MPLKVLISHAHAERSLAEAWRTLLETVSQGAVEPWYSSDTQPDGGMQIGEEWPTIVSLVEQQQGRRVFRAGGNRMLCCSGATQDAAVSAERDRVPLVLSLSD